MYLHEFHEFHDFQDNLEFQGTESIRVPAGTTAQRGTPSGSGELRYNTQLGTFEGYDGSNWGPIGAGVIDTDEDTYITAEATSDKDSLDFWTAGTKQMTIDQTGNATFTGDVSVSNLTIDKKSYIGDYSLEDFQLNNYKAHPVISMKMIA